LCRNHITGNTAVLLIIAEEKAYWKLILFDND
jgi:hypothetical protein